MRVFPRTLGITALLLTPAFHAAMAQEPAPATTPPTAATSAGTGAFGSQGQIAISVDLPFMNEGPQLAIVHESNSMGGGSSTAIAIQPSLDYFIAPHISVGGQLGIAHGSSDVTVLGMTSSATVTTFGVEARGGYELALNDSVSLWPRLGIGYAHNSYSGGGDASGYEIDLLVSVPVLWHPASHFFLGAGPALSTQLANKAEGQSLSKATDIGLTALIGGYFGGI